MHGVHSHNRHLTLAGLQQEIITLLIGLRPHQEPGWPHGSVDLAMRTPHMPPLSVPESSSSTRCLSARTQHTACASKSATQACHQLESCFCSSQGETSFFHRKTIEGKKGMLRRFAGAVMHALALQGLQV